MTAILAPTASRRLVLTLGLGYLSLLLVALTLAIGPLALLTRDRNPPNLDLRRDFGIWAAVTGLLHAVFGLQLHMSGDWLRYFFERTGHGLRLLTSLFGLSNHLGLVATFLLILLLALSNDASLRRLSGQTWKRLQQSNYALAALILGHTLTSQVLTKRSASLRIVVAGLALVTLAAQAAGIVRYRRRNKTSPES